MVVLALLLSSTVVVVVVAIVVVVVAVVVVVVVADLFHNIYIDLFQNNILEGQKSSRLYHLTYVIWKIKQ